MDGLACEGVCKHYVTYMALVTVYDFTGLL